MKHRKICVVATAMIALSLITAACTPVSGTPRGNISLGTVTDYRPDTFQPVAKNSPAPDFQMQMPDGKTVFLSDLRGKVVMLNFWATWCPYCVIEMPLLQKAYDELAARGVVIIGINTGETEKTVQKFVNENQLTFPIILDPDVYVSMLYGARYLPTTYVIDKQGNIQSGKIGAYETAQEVMTALKALLP
ncbi:MAG: TlpA disulfide reductase family protein [Dehalococcoidia bacterium]|nr:TlpA disulfide reductase family protein [Dehalococcoidia bacterium]